MPFDSTGTYTPASGATTAVPGEVIASATWNAIFTDIAAALTQLGQSTSVQTPRIITSPGSITVAVTDTVILIQASVPNINLPASATKTSPVTIIGNAAGIFGTNNSTLVPSGAEMINGLAVNPVLATDHQSLTLQPLAAGGWAIT
jgi:hypothetical protein